MPEAEGRKAEGGCELLPWLARKLKGSSPVPSPPKGVLEVLLVVKGVFRKDDPVGEVRASFSSSSARFCIPPAGPVCKPPKPPPPKGLLVEKWLIVISILSRDQWTAPGIRGPGFCNGDGLGKGLAYDCTLGA